MTDRTDRIPLPADVARCEPSKQPCTVRSKCARAIAAFPKHGASVGDFSGEPFGGGPLCPGYIAAASLRIQQERARQVKPWQKVDE